MSRQTYFYQTGSRQRGYILFSLIILVAIGIHGLSDLNAPPPLDEIVQSIPIPDPLQFELNTADSSDFDSLPGVNPWLASRIIRYRKMIGGFREVESLYQVYGLDSSRIGSWKVILCADTGTIAFQKLNQASTPAEYSKQKKETRIATSYDRKDRGQFKPDEKEPVFLTERVRKSSTTFEPKEPVDLNLADSASLEALYGIGPKLAARIPKYRDKLGFFHSTDQLSEIWGMSQENLDNILPQVKIQDIPEKGKKLRINAVTYEELKAHPYVDYKSAKLILAYRDSHGRINSEEDLHQMYGLKEGIIEKLIPYLSYD